MILGIMTLSIITLGIMILGIMPHGIMTNEIITQLNCASISLQLFKRYLGIANISYITIILSVIWTNVIMLSDGMLLVIRLSVVMLSLVTFMQ
jgi:hypothetical protein